MTAIFQGYCQNDGRLRVDFSTLPANPSYHRGMAVNAARRAVYATLSGAIDRYIGGVPFTDKGQLIVGDPPIANYASGATPLNTSKRVVSGNIAATAFRAGVGTHNNNGLSIYPVIWGDFTFHAPLTEDVFLDSGYGAASFTRATTATVKDHEGAIRNCLSGEVRFAGQRRVRNHLVNSDVGSSAWSTSGTVTVTQNYAADPFGGSTAARLEMASKTSYRYCTVTAPAGTDTNTQVRSIYLKNNAVGSVVIDLAADAGSPIPVTVTDSWQRFSYVGTGNSGWFAFGIKSAGAASSCDILAAGAQFEGVQGASNQNPSEYVSVGAAKLNELTYTEEFDNAAWSKTQITATAGQSDPLGGAGAELLAEAAASANHYLQSPSTASLPNTTNMVVSVYAKKGPGATAPDIVQLAFLGALSNTAYANFNINTGAVGTSSGCTSSIVSVGNGWHRLVATLATSSAATAQALLVFTNNNDGLGRVPSYLGVTTSNVYAFGFQVERGTTPSTYFPVGNVYPYHGACVDGVQYFSTLNGNTVASNIVTEAAGAAITRPENDGLTNGLVLPGGANNYASTPHDADRDITDDIDVIVRCMAMDYTPSLDNNMIGRWGSGAESWRLYITATTGVLTFVLQGMSAYTSTVAPTCTDGVAYWFRVTRVRSTGKINFYQAADSATVPSSWTQIGTEVSGATSAMLTAASPLYVGLTSGTFNGVIYRTILKDGIGGTTVFDADFTAQEIGTTTFTESSANAATVTVNTSGTVPAYIGNPLRLFNYDGYLAESSRTNLVLQSSNFGTTWAAVGTPTRSAAAAYCGEVALDLIGDDAGSVEGYSQIVAFTGNATKSVSFLVKQGTSTSTVALLQDSAGPTNRLLVAITWSGGVPVVTYTTGSAERASEYMGNGVWRIFCLTASVTAASTNTLYFYPATTVAFSSAETGDIYIGGVQAENYPNASASHIPTTTATVTRNADFLSYPLAGNISESLGAMYAELATHSSQVGNYAGLMGNNATRVFNWQNGAQFTDGTAATNAAGGSVWTPPQSPSKAACSWSASGNSKVAVSNGVLSTLNLTYDGTINFGTSLEIGARAAGAADCMEGIVRNARAALVKPTDADLQLITQ